MNIEKNIFLLKAHSFFTGFNLIAPLAIIYFSQVAGSFTLGMSVFSVVMVSAALLEIPTGIFSDFIGRRNTIILGSLCSFLYALCYMLGLWGGYTFLLLGALTEGLSRAFYSGNNHALLYDSLLQERKEKNFGIHLGKISSIEQFALGVAAALGGILSLWGFAILLGLSVCAQAVCLVLSLFFTEPSVHSRKSGNIYNHLKESVQYFVKNKKLRTLNIATMLSFGLGEASYSFISAFYATVWPLWAVSLAKMFHNIGASTGFWFSGKIVNKFGATTILIWGNIYNRVVNIIASGFPSLISPLLVASTSLRYGPTSVAKNILLQKEFTGPERATMGSLNSLSGSIFFAIVAYGMGFVADKVGPAQSFLLIQFLSFIHLFLYIKLARMKQ